MKRENRDEVGEMVFENSEKMERNSRKGGQQRIIVKVLFIGKLRIIYIIKQAYALENLKYF